MHPMKTLPNRLLACPRRLRPWAVCLKRTFANMFLICLASVLVVQATAEALTSSERPNIVVIIADDLGYGDLSCYGNKSFSTPNIDRLAAGGAQLMHHLSAAAICTPSRAALLTGRYPVRFGMQEAHHGPAVITNTFARGGLPQTETTFGKALSNAGYRTKYVGKWHLGWSCTSWEDQCHGPLSHGFQSFLGTPAGAAGFEALSAPLSRNSEDFRNHVLSEVFCERCDKKLFSRESISRKCGSSVFSKQTVSSPTGSQANYTNEGLSCRADATDKWKRWLDMMRKTDVKMTGSDLFDFNLRSLVRDRNVEIWPHPFPGLTQMLVNDSVEFIRSSTQSGNEPFLLVHSFLHPHVPMFTAPEFTGISGHSRYADNVIEMDWAVGRLLDALDSAGITDNTIVHFVSDNGGWLDVQGKDGQLEGGSNFPLRGGKTQGGMEGGIRVPAIFRWPRKIPEGRRVDVPTSTLDLLPTLLDAAGVSYRQLVLDGRSSLDLLQNITDASPHQYLFHYCGSDIHAIRYSPPHESAVYKLYLKMPNYADPAEQRCQGFFCLCYGDHVLDLSSPKLYDIQNDLSETEDIPMDDERYWAHVVPMLAALHEHQKSDIGIKSLLEEFDNYMMQPDLLPWHNLSVFTGFTPEAERTPLSKQRSTAVRLLNTFLFLFCASGIVCFGHMLMPCASSPRVFSLNLFGY